MDNTFSQYGALAGAGNPNWYQQAPDWSLGSIGSQAPAMGAAVAPSAVAAAPSIASSPAVNPAAIPSVGGVGGAPGGAQNNLSTNLGWNVGTGQLAVGGLTALGNLWTAYNATELAKQSFNFNKQLSSDNYTNQSQAYNTNLQNIASARGVMENQSPDATNAYIASHSVKTTV